MNLNAKQIVVEEVSNKLKDSTAFFVVHNHGIEANDMNVLRKNIRDNDGELKIIKNTLFKRALSDFDYAKDIEDIFSGPTVVAFSYSDSVGVAKAIIKAVEDGKKLKVVGGFLDSKRLTLEDVETLSKLPSKEELVAQAVRTIAAPLQGLVTVLSAMPRDLVNVLSAIKDKKDK